MRLNLYWRWLRMKRVKVLRQIQPILSRVDEHAAGDNFPVLAGICSAKHAIEER